MRRTTWVQWTRHPAVHGCGFDQSRAGGRQGLRDRLSFAALATTLAIHALLVMFLRHASVPQIVPSARLSVIEVIWIEPSTPTNPVSGSRAALSPGSTQTRPHAPAASLAQATTAARVVARDPVRAASVDAPSSAVAAAATVVTDDAWPSLPASNASARDAIGPAAFARNPLLPRSVDFEPATSLLEAKMEDRSISAKARKWFKRGVCARFRQEFRRSPESTNSLVARMRAEGCPF